MHQATSLTYEPAAGEVTRGDSENRYDSEAYGTRPPEGTHSIQ